jgi:hypothetical protein
MDYALGLRDLITDSYVNRRFTLRDQKLQQDSETVLSFNATDYSRIKWDPKWPTDAGGDDSEQKDKKPKMEMQTLDKERISGKVRGRPRANRNKDVTAADVGVPNFGVYHCHPQTR